LKAIAALRKQVVDLNLDADRNADEHLVRWLQVQNFNVNKAEGMLRKSLKWRQDNDIDSILEWVPPPNFDKAFPSEVCGYDAEGNAILVIPMKYFKVSIFSEIEKSDYIKYRVQFIEKMLLGMRTRNRETGQNGNRIISIHDLEGFNLYSVLTARTLDYLKEVGKIIDDNYPDITKAAYVTYAPRMISVVMSIVKPFLPRGAVDKTKIYGSSRSSFGKEIMQFLPAEVVPIRYGGTNVEFEKTAFAEQFTAADIKE